jgi:putative ABC transport system permease protein
MRKEAAPPRLAEFVLRLALPQGVAGESIKGDLDQEFAEYLTRNSVHRARAWYVLEALKFVARYGRLRFSGWFRSQSRNNRPSGDHIVSVFRQELRYAVRRLMRSPLFSIIAVATLAIGIGANTAIFSLVNGILLKPLPFDEPDELVGVWHTAPGLGFDDINQSPALHFTYLDEGRSFSELGIWDNGTASVTGLDEPEQVEIMEVTEGTFRALRLQPALGRNFSPEDDSPGTPLTVILSYDYWQTRFGGDRDVLGRTLNVESRPREIIGVMGADARFLHFDPAFYLPFRFDRSEIGVGNFSYQALARLAPGVSLAQANADVARMLPMAVDKFPGGITREIMEQAQFGPNLRPLKADVVGDVGEVLWVLLGTVGMILLIACANVANLFLVRAEGREKEMAVRTAMGADRARIAREFLTESLLLGGLGGLGGIAMAYGGLELLRALGPTELPRLADVTLDGQVLLFTLAISLFSGAFFGMFPILKYRRDTLVNALKEGGRGGSVGREKHRVRNTLVVAQMALALLLLVGSGLMIRSFQALRNVDPGFRNAEDVLLLRLSIPGAQVEDPVEVTQTHQLIADRISQIAGVTSVGSATSVTMDGWDSNDPIYVEEFPVPEGQIPDIRRMKWVSDSYFETMQIPLLAGRALEWSDSYELNRVVMVTENFARDYWDSPADAVGKRIATGLNAGNWFEIVGVSGNVRDEGLDQDPTAVVYWPMMLRNLWADMPGEVDEVTVHRSLNYAIRSSRVGSPEFITEVREAIWAVNPNLPLAGVRGLEELLDRSMARTSFSLIMLGIAAAVALILGAIGIYGVISYIVSQRTRELGVRLALGANAGDVKKMVLKHGMILCGIGVLIGLGAAFGLTRLLGALLYGVDPVDPLTFGAVAISLTVVALVASYVPAAKAASIDPVEAMRNEL